MNFYYIILSKSKITSTLRENNLGTDFTIISSFQKRRDTDREGDVHIDQISSKTWGMSAYLVILEQGEDNIEGLNIFSNTVCAKINEFASLKQNNLHPVSYRGEITEGLPEDDRNILDNYIIYEFVVKFSRDYYSEEIDEDAFYSDSKLINAFFGRQENSNDHMATMSLYY